MDTKTLTTAWLPYSHPSVLVAEGHQLGHYVIVRRTGQATYDLLGDHPTLPFSFSTLELAKTAGASLFAEDIADKFKAQQLKAHEDWQGDPVAPGADVEADDQGSIVLFRPRTEAARTWIEANVADDAQWFGGRLVVEHRYAPYLIEGMVGDGLAFG